MKPNYEMQYLFVEKVEIARCKENIQLKVLPSFHEIGSNGVQVGNNASKMLYVSYVVHNFACKRNE